MDFYSRIVRAKIYIDEHYSSPLDLEQLSEQACFSKFHFLRLFKKTYNKTPYQYLTEKRIQKAKERLIASAAPVIEVCEAVGFESKTSFSLKFKQYTGQTPAVFRLREMQTRQMIKDHPDRFVPSCFSANHCSSD